MKTLITKIKTALKKLFFFRSERRKHEHNLRVAAEIGYLFLDKMANEREFRRTIKNKYPTTVRVFDHLVQQIKE